MKGHGISASTMSRRMVRATARKVEELFSRSLTALDLTVLMIDGRHCEEGRSPLLADVVHVLLYTTETGSQKWQTREHSFPKG